MTNLLIKLILFTLPALAFAITPDWGRNFEVKSPRKNLYQYSTEEFHQRVMEGRKHALIYPVSMGLLIPYQPLKTFFESDPKDPVRKVLYDLARVVSPFKGMNDLYSWLGLHGYPESHQEETPNEFPLLTQDERDFPLGATIIETKDGKGLTFGCAACHTADLFGVKVLGLTNRFPRANEIFHKARSLSPYLNTFLFKDLLRATEGERLMLVETKERLKYVGTKVPEVVGLDTSLAQVGLSLAKRKTDEYATMTALSHKFPRPSKLNRMVADSKPAVWWNLKYKNRWLSDGSIVSGNPVHTNFLWNEIGRGADLKKLEAWLEKNQHVVEDLTAAVFASESPRYEKFFGVHSIDVEKAKRGEAHFVQSCQKCHGQYQKGWSDVGAAQLSKTQLVQTTRVTYHAQTPVRDVGTDPGRYLGMREFADDLNRLKISKSLGTVVEPQIGYVPPPLDGIWSRWPYFHNNSVPNLCALLTPGEKRPKTYYSGHAVDKDKDFDQDCVGYPVGEKTPAEWKKNPEHLYETKREGLSNLGHDEKIFLKDGKEIYSWEEKMELIEFLKTL